MRARYLLAILAVGLIVALAGCGGGGGGGGGVTLTTDVKGQVVDGAGVGIVGAVIEVDTGSRAIISAVTAGGGFYTLQDVPVGTDFSMTVLVNDTTLSYDNVRVGVPNGSGFTPMDIVFTTDTPPPPPTGGQAPTLSIVPPDTEVTVGSSPVFMVRVNLSEGNVREPYRAVWTVSGAAGQVTNGGYSFTLSPGAVGSTIHLRAMVRLADGHMISAERTLTVVNPDGGGGGGDGPPPPPGL